VIAAVALSDDDLTRLIKIAGLFGSNQDGERAAAARLFWELLKRNGMMPGDVLKPAPTTPIVQAVQSSAPRTWRVVTDEILVGHYGALRAPKEVEFLTGMLARGRAPTERQVIWLEDIARRCGVPLWDSVP
jgi:hypothetical protein